MNKFKSIISTFMMLAIVFITSTSAFAAPKATEGTITINNTPSKTGVSMVDHTYGAYKVFDKTSAGSGDDKGYAYSVDADFVNFFTAKAGSEDVSTEAKLNAFAVDFMENGDINEIATELMAYVKANNISAQGTNSSVVVNGEVETATINNLPLGYYVVIDNGAGDVTGPQSVIAATALGTTDTELVINLKASAPTVDKQIKDNDDGEWKAVADHQIGDEVEYQLISTVPNVAGYSNYTYILHDRMDESLTFNNNVKVFVGEEGKGGVELDAKYYTVKVINDHAFDVEVDIMSAIKDGVLKAGDKLHTYFSAILNENALIAGQSNDNAVDLEYSNNPYDSDSKDTTPEVVVKDYTFKLNALKTIEDGITALEGAEFEISIGNEAINFIQTTKEDGTNVYRVSPKGFAGETTTTIVSGTNGRFEIVGLDDNVEYTLTETKAPAGYNAIDPINFVITATYNEDGSIANISTNVDGINRLDQTFELATTIINTTGNKLPSTGGLGTKMFTLAGSVLMISASAMLVKRQRSKE